MIHASQSQQSTQKSMQWVRRFFFSSEEGDECLIGGKSHGAGIGTAKRIVLIDCLE